MRACTVYKHLEAGCPFALHLGRSAFLASHAIGCAGCVVVRGGDVTIISSTTVQYLLFVSIPFNYCLEPYFVLGISKRETYLSQLSKCLFMLITTHYHHRVPSAIDRI